MEAKANRQYGTVMTLQLFVANLNANDPMYRCTLKVQFTNLLMSHDGLRNNFAINCF